MTTNYQLFSQLCEGFVTEASTAMQQFNSPAAQAVLKHLHRNHALGHDIQTELKGRKPTWSDLKNTTGSWLLINGSKGFAGATFVKTNMYDGRYRLITGTNGQYETDTPDIQTDDFTAVAAATNHLKNKIGNVEAYYFVNSRYSRNLNRDRGYTAIKNIQAGGPASITPFYIVKRFTPLFNKILTASKADVKGVISTLVKHDAYEKVRVKTQLLQAIEESIMALEAGTVTDFLKYAVNNAILMAAKYHYPNEVGPITYRQSHYQMPVYTTGTSEGQEKLLTAIGAGEKEKLGTVLAFLKRGLV